MYQGAEEPPRTGERTKDWGVQGVEAGREE